MNYITIKQSPSYHQISLEDFLFGDDSIGGTLISTNETNTRTYRTEHISQRVAARYDTNLIIRKLIEFNSKYEELHLADRPTLYSSFSIPKKAGGLRRIDAPNDALKCALRELKGIFEEDCKALYHTSAFAYVKKRSPKDAVRRHQMNRSKWFAKLDLKNFFGNTTLDFVMRMFSMVCPFSIIIEHPTGRQALEKALSLAFLNGGLPQGTPISPLITNLIMIPIDYTLSKHFASEEQTFVYTRYADDFIISSRRTFNIGDIETKISEILNSFEAPFYINQEKTRYGSANGSNWNLGIMLNKDNQMTVGGKRKREFKAMLHNYIVSKQKDIPWELNDIQQLLGLYSYYRSIEGKVIEDIISNSNEKHGGIDVIAMIKEDLR